MYERLCVKHPPCLSLKHESSGQVFEKFSNIKFYENYFSVRRFVTSERTDGRTDGHDEANSRFPKFYENLKQAHRLPVR